MSDKYANFEQLKASELNGSFRIEVRSLGTGVALIAPHAGKIELGTSEMCKSVASDDITYYLFEGQKTKGNQDLHITSSNFDEPKGMGIAKSAKVVVTFHGQRGTNYFVNVGGLAGSLCKSMIDALNAAGFPASKHSKLKLQGRNPNNICNRGSSGQGIQLEVSCALREFLIHNHHAMARFSSTVRAVLAGV
jgi:phage replication-related protein YjqB (UPF0714/DUF867 family)